MTGQGTPVSVDATCLKCSKCKGNGSYSMVGRCYNCRTEPIVVTYSVTHEAQPVKCPVCGVSRSVHVTELFRG